jgi:hypothetical protein
MQDSGRRLTRSLGVASINDVATNPALAARLLGNHVIVGQVIQYTVSAAQTLHSCVSSYARFLGWPVEGERVCYREGDTTCSGPSMYHRGKHRQAHSNYVYVV